MAGGPGRRPAGSLCEHGRDMAAASPHPPTSVALVSAVLPEPRDAGKKIMVAGLLAYWRQRVGAENVHLVLMGHEGADTSQVGAVVHHVARPTRGQQVASVLRRSLVTGRHTLQESVLYAAPARAKIAEVLEQIGADVEIFDTVRMGQYAEEIPPRPGVHRVVFLDDLFSVRYERMLELLRDRPDVDFDPLGDFRNHLPGVAGRVADRRPVRRGLLRWEKAVVARRERAMARLFDTALLVSREEAGRLRHLVPGANVHVLPPCIAADELSRHPEPDAPTFVMIGLLTLAHNLDAAQVFLEECLPGLLEKLPDARVHIVGRGAPDSLRAQAARFHGAVSVDGYVEDLDALLARATALVMPLRFGSGIKIKVIEALAHGVPVVGTSVGAEGLDTGDDSGVVVENDPDRYGAVLADLVDPGRNLRLSQAARRHYEDCYAEQAAFRRYDTAFARP